jgi:hypothetical protein
MTQHQPLSALLRQLLDRQSDQIIQLWEVQGYVYLSAILGFGQSKIRHFVVVVRRLDLSTSFTTMILA